MAYQGNWPVDYNGEKVYWKGTGYPPIEFWDDHWKNGGGANVVIPSDIVFREISNELSISQLPATTKLFAYDKTIGTRTQFDPPLASDLGNWPEHLYATKLLNGGSDTALAYSLGATSFWVGVDLLKVTDTTVVGYATYHLGEGSRAEDFNFTVNPGDNWIIKLLKENRAEKVGAGTTYQIEISGPSTYKLAGSVTMDVNGKISETSVGTLINPSTNSSTPLTGTTFTPIAPPANAATRNSLNYVTSSGDHSYTIGSNGTVWDVYVAQKNQPNGISDWTEFQKLAGISNPDIANLANVAPAKKSTSRRNLPTAASPSTSPTAPASTATPPAANT